MRRDDHRCQLVDGCPTRARICDHIRPVYPAMAHSEFYDPINLRAACAADNIARAIELAQTARQGPPRSSGHGSPPTVITRDFTRRDGGPRH